MDFSEIKNQYSGVMPTYGRYDKAFVSGMDCTLFDEEGRSYIDFASGIGVNSIGYANPEWVKAVAGQAELLAHTSNLYYTLPAGQLAEKLTKISGMSNVFFANSGAEANEGMIKCARKYSHDKYGPSRSKIVTLLNSFHGRTVTTLAATGQDSFHQHFFPFTEGFVHCPAGDISALEAAGKDVCAVMLEVVQGEGGVLPCDKEYLSGVAALCAERDWLLLIDEVQTGFGRCGSWFAYQKMDIKPDLVSFAKGIAGGLPLGGFMAAGKCSGVLTPGTHATTFGGNPVCCAAALATLDILEEALTGVDSKGKRIQDSVNAMKLPMVKGIRGMGLMLGIAVTGSPRGYAEALLEAGLICLTAGSDAIRMLPPLVIGIEDIDRGLEIFESVMRKGGIL